MCKFGYKHTEETKEKMRITALSRYSSGFTGKKHSPESIKKISEWHKRKRLSESHKENMSRAMKNKFTLEYFKKLQKSRERRPTAPEKKLLSIINEFGLDYKYTGDSSFWIKNINPDFVNINGKKIIIEVFGDYWHGRKEIIESDKNKEITLREFGWKRIVIWENELNKKTKEEIVNLIRGINV